MVTFCGLKNGNSSVTLKTFASFSRGAKRTPDLFFVLICALSSGWMKPFLLIVETTSLTRWFVKPEVTVSLSDPERLQPVRFERHTNILEQSRCSPLLCLKSHVFDDASRDG